MAERFGSYEIERRLGAGGMAEVFLALRRGPEGFAKRVALKRVLPPFNEDADFIRLFHDEARLAAYLEHPNIAGVNDFGQVDGMWFMAMEFVDGVDLRQLMQGLKRMGQPLPTDLAIVLAIDLASALQFAHELVIDGVPAKVIHRDVSPSNVLVSTDGAVKLADFGIARAATHGHHTRTGIVKGKVPYMPPEQALADKLDPRTDLFALGVVLFEALAGVRPFDGVTELDTLQRICKGQHRDLFELAPHAGATLIETIHKLIRSDADERYPSAAALIDALASTPAPTGARRLLGKLVRSVRESAPPSVERPVAFGAPASSSAPAMPSVPAPSTPPSPRRPSPIPPRSEFAKASPSLPPAAPLPVVEADTRVLRGPDAPPTKRPAPTVVMTRSQIATTHGGSALGASRSVSTKARAAAVLAAVTLSLTGIGAVAIALGQFQREPTVAAAPPHGEEPKPAEPQRVHVTPVSAPEQATFSPRPVVPPEVTAADAGAATPPAAEAPAAPGSAGGRSRRRQVVQSEEPAAPVQVERPTARVQIFALPAGEVSIDGRSYGEAPVTATLRPGVHEVRVVLGEREERHEVRLEPGDRERVVVRFPP